MSLENLASNYLSTMAITNFRNISKEVIEFDTQFNVFYGDNGQGKTNTLEAIALATSLKPLQALKNIDLIKDSKDRAQIIGEFKNNVSHRLVIDIEPAGKKVSLDQKPLRSRKTLSNYFALVSFIPSELSMISGLASLRRRALDQIASSLFFEHGEALRRFEKVLSHRNHLLKEYPFNQKNFVAFNEIFIKESAALIYFRIKAIEAIKEIFCDELQKILGPKTHAELSYSSIEPMGAGHTQTDLMAILKAKSEHAFHEEQRRRITLVGPHLDDLVFILNHLNARKSASRGQSRALVLALKIAHIRLLESLRDQAPIIILDDIISELDEQKKKNLIESVQNNAAQCFFSATKKDAFLHADSKPKLFYVENGSIRAAFN